MTAEETVTCYVGLGSNLGDRAGYLRAALEKLDSVAGLTITRVSSVYETAPVGRTEQPPFLNLVVEVGSRLPPHELLKVCHQIEAALGRERDLRWGPRTVDLDLLWCEGFSSAAEDLTVPHPRMHERQFVLVPLAEIAPELRLRDGQLACQAARPDDPDLRRWGSL